MKKTFIISTITVAIVTFFSSFVSVRTAKETPGKIQFTSNAGSDQLFTVNEWSFTNFDLKKDAVEKMNIELTMDMGSLSCDWKDLEKNVKKKHDYFYVKSFPTAKISIKGATKKADGSYECNANLTLKSILKPIVLTFTVKEENGLHIIGKGTVNRRDFDFTGSGPQDEVPVMFDFKM
jgi:polyisoprenoid-binding protein YceI